MCDPDCPCLEEDEDNDDFNRRPRRRKKKSHKLDPCHKKPPLPLDDPDSLTPLPIYRKGLRLIQKEYKQRPCKQKANQPMPHSTPIQSCMMFSSSFYQEQFPPLEKQTDPQKQITTKPFVHSPVTPNGQLEEPKPFEAVLNWQTQNARAQNSAFRSFDEKIEKVTFQVNQTDTKVDKITSQLEQMYLDMQNRVSQLDSDLRLMIQNKYWGPEFNQKEAEIGQLKSELARINADKQQPSLFAKSPALPLHTPTFSTYQPFYTPSTSRQLVLFGLSHLKHTPTLAPLNP